ncbi:transmembrane protein adipocyte-associated 1-like [Stylophora pistillata]|uniref:Transmembrane protein adipocyte-associated 1-like n=1 Tax=Stylophora pistillata TaxID=50429 RepID=A0A2B4RM78_STYPI|nr:transmembrane protein adipocyte-associated 1-like [Stylophora pistillata]PFX18276.1 Transmembrane protein adipocyte-associated 1-like [Stylophora pistillata]
MTNEAASTFLPPNTSATEVPQDNIKCDICQKILYEAINDSHIRFLDVFLLVPNIVFLMFLMYRLGAAQVQLSKIRCPIVKTVYFMVFFVCIIGTARCFVSMLLTSILKLHHKDSLPTKILWIVLRCFLLAVELSVIIFGVWAGNMQDGRRGVRRVLCLSLFCAVAYSSTQATLEFVKSPGIHRRMFGNEKYDFYGHGGLLFLACTSLFLALVYFIIIILPCTTLRQCCVIPERRSFYLYCAVMCIVNVMQGCASLLMYKTIVKSLCVFDFSLFMYFAVFGPMVYFAFLKDFFKCADFHVLRVEEEYASYSYSYLPTGDAGDDYASSDYEEVVA